MRASTLLSKFFGRIDLIGDRCLRLHCRHLLDLRRAESGGPHMCEIESLVEAYLNAERDLVAAVEAAGGAGAPVGRSHRHSGPRRVRRAAQWAVQAGMGHHQKAGTDADAAMMIRKLQPLRYLHGCSGCFRLERSPG